MAKLRCFAAEAARAAVMSAALGSAAVTFEVLAAGTWLKVRPLFQAVVVAVVVATGTHLG